MIETVSWARTRDRWTQGSQITLESIPMAARLTLDSVLRDAITDTVLSSRREMRTENEPETTRCRQEILLDGIERAIADPEYFTLYMRHLDRVLSRPLPDNLRELLPEEREEAVLISGVGALRADEIDQMALSPYQMSQVQRAVFDGPEIPTYWVDAIDRAMAHSLRECDAPRRGIEEIVNAAFAATGLGRPSWGKSGTNVTSADELELAMTAFSTGQVPTTGPPPGVLTWTDEIPFASLEILAVHNPKELELRQDFAIQVEYRWQPTGDHGSALTVWLSGALILTGADCTARLLDAQGVERAGATVHEHTLTFQLTDVDRSEVLTGWTVACDYHKEKFVDARFATVLQPPATGLAGCLE
jgi:hypothetical protein